MKNNEFINFEEFEKVAEEIRKLVETEKDNFDKLPAAEELYLRRLQSILKEFDRVKAKGVKVTDKCRYNRILYIFRVFERKKGSVKICKKWKI